MAFVYSDDTLVLSQMEASTQTQTGNHYLACRSRYGAGHKQMKRERCSRICKCAETTPWFVVHDRVGMLYVYDSEAGRGLRAKISKWGRELRLLLVSLSTIIVRMCPVDLADIDLFDWVYVSAYFPCRPQGNIVR